MLLNINGHDRKVDATELTYEELVGLAERRLYTSYFVTWRIGKRCGKVMPDDPPVQLEEGIAFNVMLAAVCNG